jgi:nitrogenase molybdenum-iron protein NifN
MKTDLTPKKKFVTTRNACKLCSPLGAALVFRGIKGAVPFLHGSQGCATYIRRYIISHFKEPMDIASSNFNEETAVFGGKQNLREGLRNLYSQYKPELIGIATTCLTETIGEDVGMILRELKAEELIPADVKVVLVSTPSYKGTHMDGFRLAVKAVVDALAEPGENKKQINIFPGFLSAEDLRHLKEILEDFNLEYVMLPDYSETLDSGIWAEYQNIPEGGTSLEQINGMGGSAASIEFTLTASDEESAGNFLHNRFGVPYFKIGIPLGIKETDIFFSALEKITGFSTSEKYISQRSRLIDAYADSHKYVFGKKALVYGEEDLVVGLVSFLAEIGVIPILCASGGNSGRLLQAIKQAAPLMADCVTIIDDTDFMTIKEEAERLKPDFLIGNSKGYFISRKLGVPLVRVGFPIHDRIGGARILHVGYRGTQQLFDRIVNALLSKKQEDSDIGYSYL